VVSARFTATRHAIGAQSTFGLDQPDDLRLERIIWSPLGLAFATIRAAMVTSCWLLLCALGVASALIDPARAQDAELRVRVVDKATGKPVPGASVYYSDSSPEAQRRLQEAVPKDRASRPSHLKLLQAVGEKAIADADGIVKITTTVGRIHCAGEHGAATGVLRIIPVPTGARRCTTWARGTPWRARSPGAGSRRRSRVP
jgi:hypothetical protein